MFKNGVTKSVISARVGNQFGSGQVELEEAKMNDSGQVIAHPTGQIVDVFSMHGVEIPTDTIVGLAMIDGYWHITRFDK